MPQLLHRIHFTLTITLLVSLLSLTAQADAAPPVRILMIGDSTMATYNNPPKDRPRHDRLGPDLWRVLYR